MADDGTLSEQLGLDIQPALDALEPLGAALDQIATNFSSSISDAVTQASSSLSDALAQTATEQATPSEVTADTSQMDAAIADALDAPRPPVDVEGDAAPLESAISEAVTAEQPPIPIEADTTSAEASIGALSGQTVCFLDVGIADADQVRTRAGLRPGRCDQVGVEDPEHLGPQQARSQGPPRVRRRGPAPVQQPRQLFVFAPQLQEGLLVRDAVGHRMRQPHRRQRAMTKRQRLRARHAHDPGKST